MWMWLRCWQAWPRLRALGGAEPPVSDREGGFCSCQMQPWSTQAPQGPGAAPGAESEDPGAHLRSVSPPAAHSRGGCQATLLCGSGPATADSTAVTSRRAEHMGPTQLLPAGASGQPESRRESLTFEASVCALMPACASPRVRACSMRAHARQASTHQLGPLHPRSQSPGLGTAQPRNAAPALAPEGACSDSQQEVGEPLSSRCPRSLWEPLCSGRAAVTVPPQTQEAGHVPDSQAPGTHCPKHEDAPGASSARLHRKSPISTAFLVTCVAYVH